MLRMHGWDLWFLYQDTGGTRRTLTYSFLYDYWRAASWGQVPSAIASEFDDGGPFLLGGNGVTYEHTGTSDAGVVIPVQAHSGDWDFGEGRADKQLGDVTVIGDRQGVTLFITTRLNQYQTTNPTLEILDGAGRQEYLLDAFGASTASPQTARSVAVEVEWTSGGPSPSVEGIGVSWRPYPDTIVRRSTQWDDLGDGREKFLRGCVIEADTFGTDVSFHVEYDYNGAVNAVTGSPFVLTCDGRHRRFFSWPAVHAHLVRIRPVLDPALCAPHVLIKLEWFADEEPEQIARWDSQSDDLGDSYYTGLDLVCDTFNVQKTIEVLVDGSLVTNPATGLTTFPVTASGRSWIHLTFGPGRGHVYRFRATDANPGLLYSHKWHVQEEPTEQANWHQNYTLEGTLADKWIKGVLLAADTDGVNKTVQIQGDGVVQTTITVNSTQADRVKQYTFAKFRARTLRLLPTDANPGRLYQPAQWIFDEEPLALTRWEYQEIDHGLPGWHSVLYGMITIRSTADVTLTLTAYNQDGTVLHTIVKTITSTAGVKAKRFVTFDANKGILFLYLFTSAADCYIYKEESVVWVQPWGSERATPVQPFGNDAITVPTRSMLHARLAAVAAGGGSG